MRKSEASNLNAPELVWIKDDLIREGADAAIRRNLLPAAAEYAYPGHFRIVVDGSGFGEETTWPGLDSWQMAGAYLLLGRRRLVLDYFDFVTASQRTDGNIPFAVFPADPHPPREVHLNGLRDEDIFEFGPSAENPNKLRRWIGLFLHWQPKACPFRVLGAVSYLLTAREILDDAPDESGPWLQRKLSSLDRAGQYLLSCRSDAGASSGLIDAAGFYTELPPRHAFDGVTQCYVVRAWRDLAALCGAVGARDRQTFWLARADELATHFRQLFWRDDHFIEYIHHQRGPVDSHGLSDTNWAAIGLHVATDEQARLAMDRMTDDPRLWQGGMPTQTVTEPTTYEAWELNEPIPFTLHNGPLYDIAAMGRVWYLEAMSCLRMGHLPRIAESIRLVCQMGRRNDWKWQERYRPQPDGTVRAFGPMGYCEYPSILTRFVLGYPQIAAELRKAGSPSEEQDPVPSITAAVQGS